MVTFGRSLLSCLLRSCQRRRLLRRRTSRACLVQQSELLEVRELLSSITLGTTVQSEISPAGDVDTYVFTVNQPTHLFFDGLDTNYYDTYWKVTGPNGTVAENWNGANYAFYAPIAGDYSITISKGGDGTGAYGFRLLDMGAAQQITPNTLVTGSLNPANEVDLYQFSAVAGDKFYFDNQTVTPQGAYWALQDPLGQEVFNSWLNSGDVDTKTLALTGDYTLLVIGSHYDTGTTDYSFNVQPVTISSTPLTLGATVNGTISVPGESDQYTFNLSGPGWLYFDGLDTDYYSAYWRVTGPNGQPSGGEGWNGDNHPFYAPIAGAYTLTIDGNWDETKSYSFRLLDLSAATTLTYGNAVTTTLSPATETDAYQFTAAAGDKVNIIGSLSANPQNASWALYDPLGNYITSSGVGGDVNNLVLNLAGTYTLLVQGPYYDTGTTDYTLQVAFVSNTPPAAVTGTAYTLGNTVSNSFASAGQTKNFKFTLAGPAWLYFDGLDSDYYSSYWKLVGPNGTVAENWNGSNYAFYAPIAGDYQLQMSDAANQGAHNFSFRLLNLASATSMTPGNLVTGTLNSARKTDAYKFTASAGDRFFFDSQTATPQYAGWRLLDPLGQQVFSQALYSGDVDTLTLNLAGTYTLLVEGPYYDTGTTDYSFNVQPVTISSTPLTLGATVNGTISVPGESDQYTFNLAGPGWLYFDGLDSDYYSSYWKLVGPNGTVAENWNGANYAFYAPIAGAYTLTIDGNLDETKNYSFRLLDLAAATVITPGNVVNGTLDPANETDAYKFTASAGDRFFFDNQSANSQNALWRLLDPLGQQVFIQPLYYGDVDTLTLNLAGTYTLLVEGPYYDTGTSDYSFNVQPVTISSTPLTLGATVNGTISVPGESDQYTFNLSGPGWLYFDGLDSDYYNSYWKVTGPNGVPSGGESWNGDNQAFYAPIAGAYTLTIDGSGDLTNNYSFRLLDMGAAQQITPNTLVTGSLNPANEADLYQFSAVAGDKFFFDSQTATPQYAGWRLLDPLGQQVASNSLGNDLDTFAVNLTGTYTLLIEGPHYDTGTTDYSFNVQPVTISSTPLTLGATVNGTISVPGESDQYTFNLAGPGWLYFDGLDTDYYSSYWKVTGPNGEPSGGESWNGENHPFYAPIAGAYTLTIDGNWDETKSYSFRLLDLSAATTLTYGNAVTTTLSPATETDAYQFTAAAGDKVNITTSLSANPQNASWALYDPLGNYVTSNSVGGNQNNLVLNLAGTYTLLVQGPYYDTGTTDYTLKVAFVSNTPPAAVTGTAYTLGNTVSNSFASAGQTKNFKFTLAGPTWLYFDGLDSDYYSSYWKLVGPNGTVAESWNGSNDAFYAPIAGDYQLQVSDAANQGAHNFSFRLLNLASATSMTPGNLVTGTLNSARKTDAYKFTASAGDRFFFDNQTANPQSAYWRLLDPLGQQVFIQWLGSEYYDTVALGLTGTYTLLVEGPYYDFGTTDYSFNVQPVTISSTPLTLGATVNGTISVPGESDQYTFNLSGPGWLYFDGLDIDYYSSYWKLVGPNGTVAENWNGANYAFYAPIAGAYTLTIDGNGEETKSYSFRLLDLAAATVITPGNVVNGTLDPANDTDAYKFTASAGDWFFFDSQTANSQSATWNLYDPLGNSIYSNYLFYDSTTFQLNLTGTYTLLIAGLYNDAGTTDYTFVVNSIEPNLGPTEILLSNNTVAENQPHATTVGTFSTPHIDAGDVYTYTLVSGTGDDDNASFTIDANGNLKTAASFNYEVKNVYSIRVRVTYAGEQFVEKVLTINVTDVNEAPTNIALSNASIAENQPSGSVVGNFSATDVDAGDTFTYSLVSGTGSTDNASFSIVGNQLKTAASFNFEAKNSYSIRVRVTDAGGLFFNKVFTISVTDVNEAPTDIALNNTSVAENQPVGTAVGNFSTTDVDAGENFTYALVSGTGSTDNGSFSIVGNQLLTAASFDFETKSSYSIRVRVTDKGGLTFTKVFTITVTNVNEAPTDIALSNASVAENQASGTAVGNFSTTDVDAGDTFTYTLVSGTGSTDNASFTITGNQLKTAAGFNFEAKNSYSVRVRSTDAGGLSVEKVFIISVTDVNEAPTDVTLSNASVPENQPVGTVVGNFSGIDPDAGNTFTYTLVAGTGGTDNASFTIDGNQLKTAAGFDFETKSSYSIRVRVKDQDNLFFNKVFTITVTDGNDAPTDIALSNASVAENLASGTTVGNFSTTDIDAGDTFTYTLVSGTGSTDNASFTITGNQLKTAASFNFEAKNSYSVRVRSTDAGGLSFEKVFVISVTDVNEAPTNLALSNSSVTEGQPVGTVVGNFSSTDVDAGDTFTYTLVSGTGSTDNASFTIAGNQLKTAAVFNFQTKSSYAIRVRTTDSQGLSFEKQLTITVTKANAAPVIGSFGDPISYVAGGTAQLISTTGTVDDADSTTFNTLTISLTANGQGTDVLSIRNEGTASGKINTSGNQVFVGAILIGTFAGGDGTNPLVVTFNSNAGKLRIQSLLRNILFSSSVTNPSALPRTVQATLSDSDGGTSTPVSKTINIVYNPVIGNFGPAVTFNAGGAATLIASSATVGDVDSTDFNSGILTIALTANAQASDLLSIRFEGTAAGKVNTSGNQVFVGTNLIGTFNGGNGTNPLVVSLNATANPARVQALLRNILFSNSLQNPSALPRTVEVTLTDGHGGTSTPVSKQINVVPANAPPVIGVFGDDVAYAANGTVPQLITNTATISDSDTSIFDGGTLTIELTNNAEATDILSIRQQGTGNGQINTIGNQVFTGSILLGTFTGGTNGAPLVITFNSNAGALRVQAVLRMIQFNSSSVTPSALPRAVQVTMTDGAGGTSTPVVKSINVVYRPVVANFGGAITYSAGGTPLQLSTTVTVQDTDSSNFNTGTLTVALTKNAEATDLLAIRNVGTAQGQINTSGNQVFVGSILLGTFSGGSGTTPLVITLNANAGPARVQVLLRYIEFSSTSPTPSPLARVVSVTLTDGTGGVSTPVTKTIKINLPPVIADFGDVVEYQSGGDATLISSAAKITDADSKNFDTGALTIALTDGAQAGDLLSIRNQGTGNGQINTSGNQVLIGSILLGTYSGGDGANPLVITLNANAGAARVQSLLRMIQFSTSSGSTAPRTVQVTLSDGGATSIPVDKEILIV